MTLAEQLAAEQANHDPHGFKAQGANSPRHSFADTPYVHQDFPTTVYRDEKQSKVVTNADELAKAKADGWAEVEGAAVQSGTANAAPAATQWHPEPPKPALHKGPETWTPKSH